MTDRNSIPPEPENGYGYPSEPTQSTDGRSGRWAWLLILGGLLLILGWAGLKGWRVYQASQGLLSLQSEAEALLSGGLQGLDPATTVALVTGAQEDIGTLNRELGFVGALAPLLGGIPQVGPLAVAAPHLLEMADSGAQAGAIAVEALAPALAIIQQDTFGADDIGALLPILQDAAPQLEQSAAALDRYAAARTALDGAVDTETLPWRVRQLLVMADEWVPAGQAGLEIGAPTAAPARRERSATLFDHGPERR